MVENIAMLKKEIHNKIVNFIRKMVGSIQGLGDYQVYIKFKSALMKLHFSLRSKEYLLPIFLDVFMCDLIN